MSIFKSIEESDAKGKVKEIYDEIKAQDKFQKCQIFGKC